MEVIVKKMTTIDDMHEAFESTVRGDTRVKCSLRNAYKWEHSPIRIQMFKIKMIDVPSFVSVHFVRHAAVGQQHYVMSNREDRGGEGNTEVNRLSPVKHTMILNAQHLIDMARRRLCFQVSKETRSTMLMIKEEIRKVDPDLAHYMVPNCIYRGGTCSEPKPCGMYIVNSYNGEGDEMARYSRLHPELLPKRGE